MRKFAIALVAALLLSASLAADNSQTYGPLRQSPVFLGRVTFVLAQQVPVIMIEAQTNPCTTNCGTSNPTGANGFPSYSAACHTLRANLASAVARNPDSYAPIFASHMVTSVNVTGVATSGTGVTLDSVATDASLLSVVATQLSTVAGCITNP